jgi:hypothetical protein
MRAPAVLRHVTWYSISRSWKPTKDCSRQVVLWLLARVERAQIQSVVFIYFMLTLKQQYPELDKDRDARVVKA